MLDFLIKSSTDSGEKNFAVPFVGRTWFDSLQNNLRAAHWNILR